MYKYVPCRHVFKKKNMILTRVPHMYGSFKLGQSKSDTVLNSEFKNHTHFYPSLLFKEIRPFKIRGYNEMKMSSNGSNIYFYTQ